MRKRTSPADGVAIRIAIVTLDNHLAGATMRAAVTLRREIPGLTLTMHSAAEWGEDPEVLARCIEDIGRADIVLATMLFIDEQIAQVLPALQARRNHCDAMLGCMSGGEVVKLTRMGRLDMGAEANGAMAFLKRLRGAKPAAGSDADAGARQMKMLRQLPRILRFLPGAAQDLRAYFLALQYWLAGSDENVVNLVRSLVDRYADGPRAVLRGRCPAKPPVEYPDVGLYHPRLADRVTDRLDRLPAPAAPTQALAWQGAAGEPRPRVGVLVMRSYLLAGNSRHYDGVIEALEARGLQPVPAFAQGLDARPAVERFFVRDGKPAIDALVSLTGFSLVGGPAYHDTGAAETMLAALDVPYVAAHPVEFQPLEVWQRSERGLNPLEATMMVAIPELDGATGPMVFGGRSETDPADMRAEPERAAMLAARVARLVALRRTPVAERRVAVVLFNYPPNGGAAGTAAGLSVFASLHATLVALAGQGYQVDVPADVDALRERLLAGNASRWGAPANVHARIELDDHVRRERWLSEIESAWGPAPGRQLSDGAAIQVLGERFGNVFVGLQPGFGYEGDPMRLLFDRGMAPTHAFSAFYRWIREDFGAGAVLHFGTHGALEFMPGKQCGLSQSCWPDRLIGDLPNLNLYAANNPSEGTIAKRRAAATLLSYLTPPIAEAGLYRGLLDLKASVARWRSLEAATAAERPALEAMIHAQAAAVDLAPADATWHADDASAQIERIAGAMIELEQSLIPCGMHVLGQAPAAQARAEMLGALARASGKAQPAPAALEALADGVAPDQAARRAGQGDDAEVRAELARLAPVAAALAVNGELQAVLRALDGRFVRPACGGDLLHTTDILPTGRNLHGFDPFRIPSAFAIAEGERQARRLLARHAADGHPVPESIALVLWGTDNLKTEGGPIGQALALLGARPRFDGYGRLAGAELIPLTTLGRPRIDVTMTLSGIFRDLLPLQTRLLAEAAYLAAAADEPPDQNFVHKHALAYMAEQGCDLDTAALRVFSNADQAYGSNVNQLIDSGAWQDEGELADAYSRRKCFAYGRNGRPQRQAGLLKSLLADADLAYQNLDSVEVGVTTVDHYFDTLGGISKAVQRARGRAVPVYIADHTQGEGKVRTLGEQVALEARTRVLNPKWYDGMLLHGYEGVRQIESAVTNVMGWSATTGDVAPWVYQQVTRTFVLDEAMRERLASLNPTASLKLANRLIEAAERSYWAPDPEMLDALRRAGEALEDRIEGVTEGIAA